ncbi:MAG: type IX secretion system protein PorQ [Bacteroidia bacterium]|nr:type IX secretion system protein PorQ [Bacteroidia bacterium]
MRFGLLFIFLTYCYSVSDAQIGGRFVFDFLRLSPGARIAANGGANVSLYDRDLSVAFFNPSINSDSMHSRGQIGITSYLADISYGSFAYSHRIAGNLNLFGGLQYVNYGKFTEADEFGNRIGNFRANDIAFVAGLSRSFGEYVRFGGNFKFITSSIAGRSALGIAMDLGGLLYIPEKRLSVGVSFSNVGAQLKTFSPADSPDPLPLDLQIGVTHKLAHTPLRLSLTLVNLVRPTLIYKNPYQPTQYDLAGQEIPQKISAVDNIFRHLVFGTELVLSKNFHIRFGYNHQRRQELKRQTQGLFLTGMSFGVGLRVSKFYLDYAYSNFHAVGGVHQWGISTYLNSFQKNP